MQLTIDRFEGAYAVCETESGIENILRSRLPDGAGEGTVLKIENSVITIDHEETERRREKMNRRLKSLWG